jgi:hypothetical protein
VTDVPGWTIGEAVRHLDPPIPRRTLAALLADVPPSGRVYGRRGRRPAVYPVAEIMDLHRDWVDRMLARQGG